MAVVPSTIDIVVADMAASLTFYRDLGLAVPDGEEAAVQVEIVTPGGAAIGLLAETMMRQAYPDWVTPVGTRDVCVPLRHGRRGRSGLCGNDPSRA